MTSGVRQALQLSLSSCASIQHYLPLFLTLFSACTVEHVRHDGKRPIAIRLDALGRTFHQ